MKRKLRSLPKITALYFKGFSVPYQLRKLISSHYFLHPIIFFLHLITSEIYFLEHNKHLVISLHIIFSPVCQNQPILFHFYFNHFSDQLTNKAQYHFFTYLNNIFKLICSYLELVSIMPNYAS
ncbi:hypothetical protein VIGAN_01529000 [Vigna angularis var. angularis]|uniref:Uncharacterized protein n=1 Tax=Vigna angularis var. angularis TaxID=157739 RepID=A0A0S3R943_PHAAN|nr:hypothetical protein VIGAN_01529000 [Vigna angularis var. angularis]